MTHENEQVEVGGGETATEPCAPVADGVRKCAGCGSEALVASSYCAGCYAPWCTVCGKQATRQDIDGDWWPPCEHAGTHGLGSLKYRDCAPIIPVSFSGETE